MKNQKQIHKEVNRPIQQLMAVFCSEILKFTKYVIYLYSDNNNEVIITKK